MLDQVYIILFHETRWSAQHGRIDEEPAPIGAGFLTLRDLQQMTMMIMIFLVVSMEPTQSRNHLPETSCDCSGGCSTTQALGYRYHMNSHNL